MTKRCILSELGEDVGYCNNGSWVSSSGMQNKAKIRSAFALCTAKFTLENIFENITHIKSAWISHKLTC